MVTAVLTSTGYVFAQDKPSSSSSAQVSKAVGVIKSIQADSLTIVAESGNEVTAQLTGSTKILRVPPGEKDLKNATVLQAQDLQPGDRVLVRGQASADGHAIAALAVIVMKQADVAAKQQQRPRGLAKARSGWARHQGGRRRRHHHNFIRWNGREPEYRHPHCQGYDLAPLRARLGEVRRRETGAIDQIKAGRSVARARNSQRRMAAKWLRRKLFPAHSGILREPSRRLTRPATR